MQPISVKKILIVLLIIITLSQLHKIAATAGTAFQVFYEAFEPLRNSPPLARYTAALAFLALVWVTGYILLLNRRK